MTAAPNHTMKYSKQFNSTASWCHLLRIVIACLGLSLSLRAQQAAPTDKEDTKETATDESVVKLNVFTVEDTKGQGYGASNLASATRLNTPAENVPQSISVINANLMKDIGAYEFDQAIRYTVGVTPRQNAPDVGIVRGFIVGNRFRNGFYMPRIATDIANLDRIEIIKGPSASIAGSSESGGLVNFITKRPLFQPANSISASIGSYGFYRATLDTTGPIPHHDNMAFRLIASATEGDTYRDNDHNGKAVVYPSFQWNITEKSQLLVEVELLNADYPPGFGAVYLAPVDAGAPFSTVLPAGVTPKVQTRQWAPLSTNTSGEPGMHWKHNVTALFATFSHQFNEVFSVRQALAWYEFIDDHYWASANNTLFYDSAGEIFTSRTSTNRWWDERGFRLQGDLALKKQFAEDKFGAIFLAGYDVGDVKYDLRQSGGTLQPMNLMNPVYGLPAVTPLTATNDSSGKNGSVGIFANGQFSMFKDRIILTGGLRRDYNKAASTVNHFNNTTTNTPKTPTIQSPLVGITVKPLPWMAVYAVDSEAGAAQTTIAIYPGIPMNDPLQKLATIEPVTTNKEFGVKMQFLKGNFTLNFAKFKIVQSDFVRPQTDFSAPGGSYRIIDQGVTSDGYEIEWAGDVTKQLLVFGGYTNLKVTVPAVRVGGLDGEQRGVPRHKFQLFTRYNFANTKESGFSVRAGVVYQTSVWGIAQNTFKVPGATRYDVGADYRWKDWSVSFTVENLTDVIFPQATVGAASNTVDAPRTTYCSVTRKF